MIRTYDGKLLSPKEAAREICLALGEQTQGSGMDEWCDAACIRRLSDSDAKKVVNWMSRAVVKVSFRKPTKGHKTQYQ